MSAAAVLDLETPIRGELLSTDRLEQLAETIASEHAVLPGEHAGRPLLKRLDENGRALLASYREMAEEMPQEGAVSPAAEWLVDNFHIVEEQVREVRDDLPPNFYKELPKLASGDFAGYPRVYAVAWTFVEHTDSRFDSEALRRFVTAYQKVRPLTIGELWAIAISLRLVLVENLRRMVDGIERRREERALADRIADDLLGSRMNASEDAAPRWESLPPSRPLLVQLFSRLRDRDPATTPALRWLNSQLAKLEINAEELVSAEHQEQVATHISVRNVITSMRLLSSVDWSEFFESVSLVEATLREGTHVSEMDFPTRDRYRRAVEELARGTKLSELEIARRATQRAREDRRKESSATNDPGYFLISRGRKGFEKELRYSVPVSQSLRRAWIQAATPGYIGTIVLLTLAFAALAVIGTLHVGSDPWSVAILALLWLVPASDIAVAVVNRDVTKVVGPRPLPKLELKAGIPESLRTLVAVPILLTTEAEAHEAVERLEVHYLGNADGNIRLALLSDWSDAPQETSPGDEAALAAAIEGIAALNARHGEAQDGGSRFFLFHRRRVYNKREDLWMGWERKRGKLHELNRLLRGADDTSFLALGGSVAAPSGIRYVVTLDADTRLPRGGVRRLVGAMAHPLNQPVFDPSRKLVVEGHGIMQPRVTPTLPIGGPGTIYQRLFSGPRGIDPYAFAVSDVYQDLFDEGIYTGKGIYDLDAFERALAGRVPDDSLLSHDLFEGLFARAGLVSDIEIFEDFPGNYEVAASRQHRWARGDWQLLPWLRPRVPDGSQGHTPNPLTAISRWKIIDNLRRSLSPLAAAATLIAAWTLFRPDAVLWTALVVASIALPGLLSFLGGVLPRRKGIAKRSFLHGVSSDTAVWLGQTGLRLVLLADQAWQMGDAIVRTLGRLMRRRRLLEWRTTAQASRAITLKISGFYQRMSGAVLLAVLVGLGVAVIRPESWPLASGFVAAWALSPLIARAISVPPREAEEEPLSDREAAELRQIARRTYRYFETFAGSEDNWLPADNFQETPEPTVAHRTSPTNMGLALLATVAANDLGWAGSIETLDRIEATLGSMDKLERFRGHFFNWYDTGSRKPLEPRYISTVDSGNLAGHLIALRYACLERLGSPLVSPRALQAIGDTLGLLRESSLTLAAGRREGLVTRKQIDAAVAKIEDLLAPAPRDLSEWLARLRQLAFCADTLVDTLQVAALDYPNTVSADAVDWATRLASAVASQRRDAEALLGWDSAPEGISAATKQILEGLDRSDLTLETSIERYEETARQLRELAAADLAGSGQAVSRIAGQLEHAAQEATALVRRLTALARAAAKFVEEMSFQFLFDPERKLFSIGYRMTDGRLDSGYYDLLASEARLASFIAIARGDVPTSHWFQLGRSLTPVGNGSALISWSGSMFEYLMPELVMESPSGSLLDQTNHLVVERQIRYGEEHTIPWGISESAYNLRDQSFTYQYSNFGISGLGLKRGLSQDLVVAPYASALASMLVPREAGRNFEKLTSMGAAGRYGFYEAIDFTPAHIPEGDRFSLVRAFMAHHQGMSIVALANVLCDGVFRERFHTDPAVQATELLLQERTPRTVAVARPRSEEVHEPLHVRDFVLPALRRFTSPHHPIPRTHLLSNGRYSVMITEAGSGYSRWRDRDVTRWREDSTRDCWGTYVLLRDTQTGKVWSAGYQPAAVEPETYEAIFSEDRVEIHRRDGPISTLMQVVVSPEDDAEIRHVSISNLSLKAREIEITSFAELALAPAAADSAHPAFSKLFVQTEFVPGLEALLASRRPRESDQEVMWVAHVAAVEGETLGAVQYETDRARFLGRARDIRDPASMEPGRPLSNTTGSVLDPIISLRRRFRLRPGGTARIYVATIAAETREKALTLADKYREPATFERTMTLAWTQAQVQLHHLGIAPEEAHLFQRVANRIIYNDPGLRAPAHVIARNQKGPSALWQHGISGDVPIVLVRIDHPDDQDIVRQLLRAHEYWRLKGLVVDLVISNEQPTSYGQELRAALDPLVRMRQRTLQPEEKAGGVFQIRTDLLSEEDRDVLRTAARVVLLSRHGTLSEQVLRLMRAVPATPPPRPAPPRAPAADVPPPAFDLDFFNGFGGFAEGGREYVTILAEKQSTPAPWINVVANPSFGFLASESGGGYTWAANSQSDQLTPWSNDPVSDPPGEALYVRDERTGEIWTPTALPIRDEWPYVARHGQGYSRFSHESRGIALELLQFVPVEDPVKVSRLTLENRSRGACTLSVTAYTEWVLGGNRAVSAPFIVTERDEATGAVFARNPWNEQFGGAIAFADLGGRQTAWTADREEFLGRNGSLAAPAAMAPGAPLSGRAGAGRDPCSALRTTLELAPGSRAEIIFLLGQGRDAAQAQDLIRKYRRENLDECLAAVQRFWEDVLGALQVSTPDRSMDLMLNRWLLYQALCCRIWARTAFYQASGAYGFRDQLQDSMALTVAKREIAREHILRAAGRQFPEGDVQHWWHVPKGEGVRTRISDDPVWLPYATIHYLEVTGDKSILEEPIPFIEGEPLKPDQTESYFEPTTSANTATLFEHCARALDARLTAGAHGLPLMGTGDWNDGMNHVGRDGRGESVWLGWFLHTTLWEFARIAEARGETERAHRWRERVDALKIALESEGWDGDWYRRAFFDDGTPLGSSVNTECRIDSIAQSWGVVSGAADRERRQRAMAAVEEYLVKRGDGLVLLFTPPFDKTPLDPGYIKGYLPGIRENGGQYTHGALWAVIAFASLGQGDKAGELFAILNPINHASTRAGLHRYKVEPYVAAADIYAETPHVGRGGWTWYTGSAGWMYRAGVESILGFRLRGASLHLDPCIPHAWPGYSVTFRYHSARYELTVENPSGASKGVARVELDGEIVAGGAREIPLADDGKTHKIRVVLG